MNKQQMLDRFDLIVTGITVLPICLSLSIATRCPRLFCGR